MKSHACICIYIRQACGANGINRIKVRAGTGALRERNQKELAGSKSTKLIHWLTSLAEASAAASKRSTILFLSEHWIQYPFFRVLFCELGFAPWKLLLTLVLLISLFDLPSAVSLGSVHWHWTLPEVALVAFSRPTSSTLKVHDVIRQHRLLYVAITSPIGRTNEPRYIAPPHHYSKR